MTLSSKDLKSQVNEAGKLQSAVPGQNRLRLVMIGFALCFAVITGRIIDLSVWQNWGVKPKPVQSAKVRIPRPDITDRNGVVLASDIRIASLYANPRQIINVDEAVEGLTAVMPDMNAKDLRKKLSKDRSFIWLKREVSPSQQAVIYDLGIPGLYFRNETRRVYPMGRLAAHVLGFVDVDSHGLAGIEKYLDDNGAIYTASLADPNEAASQPAVLSLDARVQYAVTEELQKAIDHFKAKAAAGVVMNIHTGEVEAMVSLPDYNPNHPESAQRTDNMNRVTTGVFELGSVIKAVTFAMAFDAGVTDLNGKYDATRPLVIGHNTIHDFHAQRRVLTVPEVFLHSSNIGTAKMALDVGIKAHKAFLRKAGMFDRLITELPENAQPLYPKHWGKINTVTASFGHGFAVAPLQGAMVTSALINGGYLLQPTFLKRNQATARAMGRRLVSEETSRKMRYLFRLNAEKGTARKADQAAVGYRIGGKTGTAEKVFNGRYDPNRRLNSFVGAFPMDDPQYVMLMMLDEPQPLPETFGFATSGWNTVPTAGKVVARIAPLLDVEPSLTALDMKQVKKNRKKALAN